MDIPDSNPVDYFFDEELWEFEDDNIEYEIDNDVLFFDDKDIKRELGNLLISNYRSSSLNAKFYSHKLDNFFDILKPSSLNTMPFDKNMFCDNVKILVKFKKFVFNDAGEREKVSHIFDTNNIEEVNLNAFFLNWTKGVDILTPICTNTTKCKQIFKYDTDVVYYWNNGEIVLEDMRLVSGDCVEPIGLIFTNKIETKKYEILTKTNSTDFLTKNCIVLFEEGEKMLQFIPSPDAYLLNSKNQFFNTRNIFDYFPSFERIPGLFHSIKKTIESNTKAFKRTKKIKPQKQIKKQITKTSISKFLKYKSYPYNNSFIDDDFGRFHHLLQRNDKGIIELLLDMEKFNSNIKVIKPQTFPVIKEIDKLKEISRNGFVFQNMLDALNDHKYIHSDEVAFVRMHDNIILPLRKQMLHNKLIWILDHIQDDKCHKYYIKVQNNKKDPPIIDLLCIPNNFMKDLYTNNNLHIQKDNLISIEGRNSNFVSMIKTQTNKQIKSLHLNNVWNYEKIIHHKNTYLEESIDVLGDIEYVSDPSIFNSVLDEGENIENTDIFLKRIDNPSITKLGRNIARIVQSMCVEIPNSQLLQLENFINLQFNDTELHTRKLTELKPILQKIKAMAIQNKTSVTEINKQIQDAQISIDKKYTVYKSKFNDIAIFIVIAFLIIYIQTKLPTVLINPSALPAKDEANILGYPLSDQKVGIIPYFASIIMYYMKQDLQVFMLSDKYEKEQIIEKITTYVDLLLKKGTQYKDMLKSASARIIEAKNDEQFRIQNNIAKFGVWDMFRPPIKFDENKNITNEAAIFVKSMQLFANKQEVYLFRSDKTKYRINSCCRVPILEVTECLSDFYQTKQISDILNKLVHKDIQKPCTFNFKRTQLSKTTSDYEINHKTDNYDSNKYKLKYKLKLHFDEYHNLKLDDNNLMQDEYNDLFQTTDTHILDLKTDEGTGALSQHIYDLGKDLLKIIEDTDNRVYIETFQQFLKIAVNIDMNKIRGHVYVNHANFIQSVVAFFSKIKNDYVFNQVGKEAMLKKMNILTGGLNEYILSSKELALIKEIKGSHDDFEYIEYMSKLHENLLNVDPYKSIILNIYILFKHFIYILTQTRVSNNLKTKMIDVLVWIVNDYIIRYNLAFSNNDFVREEYEKQREMKKQDTLKKTKNVGDETLGIFRELKKRNMLFDLSILNDNLETNVDIQIEGEGDVAVVGEGVILYNNDAFDMEDNNMPGEGEGDD